MKYKGIIVLSFVFLLALLALFFCFDTTKNDVLFSFKLTTNEGVENIYCWNDEDKEIYVFLPSYAEMSDLTFVLNTDNEVTVNDKKIYEGMGCQAFELDTPYKLVYNKWGKLRSKEITFCRSANVPALYIDTNSGNMDYIHQSKGNEEQGSMRLYSVDDKINYSGEIESINGRGNSTWKYYDKKSYSIKLTNEADLLSMGAAQKWILLANADDTSNIRNKLVYDFAEDFGLSYTPESQWVDLYLNGEYAGLYLLCERNEVHEQRVNAEGEASFLVSAEIDSRLESQNFNAVSTALGQSYRVHYPLTMTQQDSDNIKYVLESLERAICAEDGIDPTTNRHYSKIIDVDSFARKYLIEEVFGNVDAGFISQYYYYDSSDEEPVLYAGPVWDYGYSMGNREAWQLENYQSIYADRLEVKPGYTSPIFYYLLRDEEFKALVTDIYENEFLPLLSDYRDNKIDEYLNLISDSSKLNQMRWFDETDDVALAIGDISFFLENRADFLSSYWSGEDKYYLVRADKRGTDNYAYYAVREGECLSELVTFKNTDSSVFCGWKYVDTDEAFDVSSPITEDTYIYASWEKGVSEKVKNIINIAPLVLITFIFFFVFVTDIRRMKGKV